MNRSQFPVYVISKGRSDCCLTADFFLHDNVDFKLVIEPQEKPLYLKKYPKELLLVLPFSNLGLGGIPARNWVWEHAKASGAARHWIFDDNIRKIRHMHNSKRIPCNTNAALFCCETFGDRYKNIGIYGLNYTMFVVPYNNPPPFYQNVHVYSALCIDNSLPFRWRGRYNEDTDLCLQVLSAGLCTVLFNAFSIDKVRTQTMKGGNTTELYQNDGRLKMARSLERLWPGVVSTKRRFGRPQHHIKNAWGKFDTVLIPKTTEIKKPLKLVLVACGEPKL
jgi:hypothetical protein